MQITTSPEFETWWLTRWHSESAAKPIELAFKEVAWDAWRSNATHVELVTTLARLHGVLQELSDHYNAGAYYESTLYKDVQRLINASTYGYKKP